MGIVAHSSPFFFKGKKTHPLPLLLPIPPKQYDYFRGYNFAFQFLPSTRWKKLQNWSLKPESHAEPCVCFGGKWGVMKRKEAETHCVTLVCSQTTPLTPASGASGSLFFKLFMAKKKNVLGNGGGNLFFKTTLFSHIPAMIYKDEGMQQTF